MRALRIHTSELVVCLAVAAVVVAAYFAPRDRPGDLDPAPAAAPAEPAPVGLASAIDCEARPGCFIVVRHPDGPGHAPSHPWTGTLRVGAQIELAGRWYRVVGPAAPGDLLAGETAVLAGDRPGLGPWPFRVAPEGGR